MVDGVGNRPGNLLDEKIFDWLPRRRSTVRTIAAVNIKHEVGRTCETERIDAFLVGQLLSRDSP